jgi:hypothetical protein
MTPVLVLVPAKVRSLRPEFREIKKIERFRDQMKSGNSLAGI